MRPEGPPWLVVRMTGDVWFFGLLTAAGLIGISHIFGVWDDWLDVDLLPVDDAWLQETAKRLGVKPIGATVERPSASVRASAVIMAFELADT